MNDAINTVLPANDNRTAYAVILDPFSDRPLYWTGGTLSVDVADLGGFDYTACERAATFYKRCMSHPTYEFAAFWERPTYQTVAIVKVIADRWGNVQL